MPNRKLIWASGALVAALALVLRLPLATGELLRSDAADYLRTFQYGLASSYFETKSAGFLEFVSQYRDKEGVGAHIWDHQYRQGDASALRHYHVPAAFYPHILIRQAGGGNAAHRFFAAILGSLTCGAIAVLLMQMGAPLWAGAATGALLAANPAHIRATTDLSPHPMFMLLAVLYLFFFERLLASKREIYLAASAVLLGAAIATLELAPVLVVASLATLCVCMLREPEPVKTLRQWSVPALRALGLCAAACFVLWPGGVLRGGYLKSYGVFVGQALFKRDELFRGRLTPGLLYDRLFNGDPFLAALAVVGIAAPLALVLRKSAGPRILLFAAYAAVSFALAFGNGFRNATYASEVLAGMVVAAGTAMYTLRGPSRAGAAALAVAAVFTSLAAARALKPPEEDAVAVAVRELPSVLPARATVLANYERETYAAYLPAYVFEATADPGSIEPRPLKRGEAPFEYILVDERYAEPDAMRRLESSYARIREFKSSQVYGKIALMRLRAELAGSREKSTLTYQNY